MQVTLWKRRSEKRITLMELQELTGISKSTLNNIENGRTSPTINQLERIAIALNVRIRDLLISEHL